MGYDNGCNGTCIRSRDQNGTGWGFMQCNVIPENQVITDNRNYILQMSSLFDNSIATNFVYSLLKLRYVGVYEPTLQHQLDGSSKLGEREASGVLENNLHSGD